MNRLAVIHNGAYTERKVLDLPQYASRIAAQVYLPEIGSVDLSQFDAVIVPEGSHHRQMQAASAQLGAYVADGGAVMAFGDQPVRWLPQLDWEFRVARLAERDEVLPGTDESTFHRYVAFADLYHHHGVFHPAGDIDVLYGRDDGSAILYREHLPGGGMLLAGSLDLFVHAALQDNPVSYRFLDGFLAWASIESLRS